ncbi:ComEA family DNA-binding protein [Deinococcus multiflagellatus]|uniref:ComEA family DNA-binding protein n=1 Tax=Deinococcus multiflagellatus TaxID=1656887 RepID=A0ABW1ZJD3_9DEIO|nr:helix-hairpin-helix domain-containing protein [Deinococcus multiflagellatus]MBZ9713141.1 helix-hairpin-helix domain-containing protein [Deinococcus multiflagellatus]
MPSSPPWNALLAGGVLLTAALSLGPVIWPRAQAPQVTRVALPAPAATAPSREAPTSPATYPATASVQPLISGRLNLNTATTEQLEALPKVGPALAARIVAGRPYRTLADLDRVKGIGPSALKTLQGLVTF